MSTHIGIGFSEDMDMEQAAQDAAFQSKTNLKENRIDLAIVFSTIHYSPDKTFPVLQKILNKAPVIGCSTAGIILPNAIKTRGIGVLTITSDEINFGLGSIESIDSHNTRESGTILAQTCLTNFGKQSRQAFLFFADSHLKDNSVLLSGIQDVLGNVFPIVGAGSCDDFHFSDTFQMCDDKVLTNSAAGLILGGHLSVGISGRHGWRPLGKPRRINKTLGNIIKVIDGKKAASLYYEFLGEDAKSLGSTKLGQMAILYPLGIYIEGSPEYLIRNAIAIQKDGSIICQGEVPEGARVHIMLGNKESCQQAAIEAAEEARKNLFEKKPQLIIIIESMARLKLLGRMAFQEIQKIKNIFGHNVPIFGMYANGEVWPFQSVGHIKKPYLQNESIAIVAIS